MSSRNCIPFWIGYIAPYSKKNIIHGYGCTYIQNSKGLKKSPAFGILQLPNQKVCSRCLGKTYKHGKLWDY